MIGLTKQISFQSLIILKVKITTTNIFSGILWAPTKIKSNARARKVHVLCVGNFRHYVRECRYRKDQKRAIVNAIDEEIIATLSDVCVV